jgi:serine phosphatase RsbU (regulator of sigma subunit)
LHDSDETLSGEVETAAGRILERHSAPIVDTSGEPLGRVEMLIDVTPYRQALIEAQQLATEAARLRLEEERRAQEETALARAAHMMASALTLSDIHEHLLDQAAELSGSDAGAVLVVDAHGEIQPAATRRFSDDATGQMVLASDDPLVARVIAGRRPFICNDADAERRAGRSIPAPDHVQSFVQVPLALGERVYGVLWVTSRRLRAFGARELRLLSELGRHAEAAIQNALQFEQERHIAATLQYALLPDDLPVVPGLSMAALYRAAAGSRVGGDFYGAWSLPGGQIGVVVGDVSGKGAEAAGVTAMVRYMVEGMSMREPDPGRLLSDLGDLIHHRLPEASLVTVLLMVIDADRAGFSWSSAGHVPALLLDGAGVVHALEDPGPPCGAFPGTTYTNHQRPFGVAETLVLYTDGILEAHREGEQFGEERLAEIVSSHAGDPPRGLARAIYSAARVWTAGHIDDDVAIAVVNRTG